MNDEFEDRLKENWEKIHEMLREKNIPIREDMTVAEVSELLGINAFSFLITNDKQKELIIIFEKALEKAEKSVPDDDFDYRDI
jgi:hypothetical protein